MNVLSVGFPGAWSLLTDDAGWTWSETCVAADSMPVRSIVKERRRGERMDGAWVLYFSSVCSSRHCLILGLVGLERRRREKINLTSALGQETRDSHSDPAFLTIITPKFLCGIWAEEQHDCWTQKLTNDKAIKKRLTIVILMWLFIAKQDKRFKEKFSMLTCSHEKTKMLTFSRCNVDHVHNLCLGVFANWPETWSKVLQFYGFKPKY